MKKLKKAKKDEWCKPIRLIILMSLVTLGCVLIILGIPSRLGGEAWIGFWGSIAGAIIGGIITVITLKKTIEIENKTNKDNNHLQIKPFIVNKLITSTTASSYNSKIDLQDKDNSEKDRVEFSISMENIGLGTAVALEVAECSIGECKDKLPYNYRQVGTEEFTDYQLINLKVGQTQTIHFIIDISRGLSYIDGEKNRHYPCKIKLNYKDLLDKLYTSEIRVHIKIRGKTCHIVIL